MHPGRQFHTETQSFGSGSVLTRSGSQDHEKPGFYLIKTTLVFPPSIFDKKCSKYCQIIRKILTFLYVTGIEKKALYSNPCVYTESGARLFNTNFGSHRIFWILIRNAGRTLSIWPAIITLNSTLLIYKFLIKETVLKVLKIFIYRK